MRPARAHTPPRHCPARSRPCPRRANSPARSRGSKPPWVRLRAERAASFAGPRAGRRPRRRARADLGDLDAILASYLRTVGVAGRAPPAAPSCSDGRALEAPWRWPFALDATEARGSDRTFEDPYSNGARPHELVRDFGAADRNAMGKVLHAGAFVSHIWTTRSTARCAPSRWRRSGAAGAACGSGRFRGADPERLAPPGSPPGVDPRGAPARADAEPSRRRRGPGRPWW